MRIICQKTEMEMMNAPKTVPAPIRPIRFLGNRFPNTPLNAAPSRGRMGMSQRNLMSPLQQVASIDIQRFAIAKHRDYQRQSNCRFRRGDDQHKENKNLAADL